MLSPCLNVYSYRTYTDIQNVGKLLNKFGIIESITQLMLWFFFFQFGTDLFTTHFNFSVNFSRMFITS